MTEFFNVLPPDEARDLLFEHLTWRTPVLSMPTYDVLGRITGRHVYSPENLPYFRRSTMDGFAVRATDTYGASESLPAMLSVVGEIKMGQALGEPLKPHEAIIIHTGGRLPDGADAVVQIEHTQMIGAGDPLSPPYEIEVFKAVASGQNVLQVGEDVRTGEEVLPAGHQIRPQDLGGILALGIQNIEVHAIPRIAVISTGDELISPDKQPNLGQIRDINSYTIGGQIKSAGAIATIWKIVPDVPGALLSEAKKALADHDMLVISAGSSVSARDLTAEVIDELGEPGVLLHGVATRPGKPTIAGIIHGKPVLGLPGNPVSAMVQFAMFGIPAIYRLQGLQSMPRRGIVWAKIDANISSETGREDFVPVKVIETPDGMRASPVFGKSNLIYTLVKADGLAKVPLNVGGLTAGEIVEVQLF